MIAAAAALVGYVVGWWLMECRNERRDLALLRAMGWPYTIANVAPPTYAEINAETLSRLSQQA